MVGHERSSLMTGSNFVDLAQRYGNSVPVTRLTREAGHMLDIDTFTEQWVSPRPASEAKLAFASDVAGRSASRAWSRRPRPIAGEATATEGILYPHKKGQRGATCRARGENPIDARVLREKAHGRKGRCTGPFLWGVV